MQNCNCNWYEYRLGEHLVSIEENQRNKNKKHWGEVHAELKVLCESTKQ